MGKKTDAFKRKTISAKTKIASKVKKIGSKSNQAKELLKAHTQMVNAEGRMKLAEEQYDATTEQINAEIKTFKRYFKDARKSFDKGDFKRSWQLLDNLGGPMDEIENLAKQCAKAGDTMEKIAYAMERLYGVDEGIDVDDTKGTLAGD